MSPLWKDNKEKENKVNREREETEEEYTTSIPKLSCLPQEISFHGYVLISLTALQTPDEDWRCGGLKAVGAGLRFLCGISPG